MFQASESQPLQLAAAQRLERFVERGFDPKSDSSWSTLQTMWNGALLARDDSRLNQPEVSK